MTQGAAGAAREVRLPRPPGGPAPWALGAAALALALVAVVTASGPVDVVSQPLRGSAPSLSLSLPPTTTAATVSTSTRGVLPPLNDLPTLSPLFIAAIQLVVAVAVGWILALLARYAWRSVPRVSTRAVTRSALTPLPAVPDELVDSADARMALLQEGSPRNAIVACWVDLEDSASAAGLPRRPSETAAEYTVRVLRTWDIAPDAMGALAELYREARYSRHPLTEHHRQVAVERLTAVHDDLRRVVAGVAQDAGRASS
ncbi:MAG: DUF4129 domain-containing protein [Lapillicoccus sp.]